MIPPNRKRVDAWLL